MQVLPRTDEKPSRRGAANGRRSTAPRLANLCDFLARHLGLSPKMVSAYAADLRAAGHLPRSKAGRGNAGGAEVDARAAANLLTALLSSATVYEAAEVLEYVARLEYRGAAVQGAAGESLATWRASSFPRRQETFTDWLARTIEGERRGDAADLAMIRIAHTNAAPSCQVSVVAEDNPSALAILIFADHGEPTAAPCGTPLWSSREISGRILRALADFLGPTSSESHGETAA